MRVEHIFHARQVRRDVALHVLAGVLGNDARAVLTTEWDAAGQLARLDHHDHPDVEWPECTLVLEVVEQRLDARGAEPVRRVWTLGMCRHVNQ